MTIELITYTGMSNENRLELVQDGVLVVASAITGAILKFGDYCVDTDNDPDNIYFLSGSDNQILCFRLGLIPDIVSGRYRAGMLTLVEAGDIFYDAWSSVDIWVKPWSVCPVI